MSEPTYTAAAVPSWRLWYGITAALSAWVIQGGCGFVIADAACSGKTMSERGLETLMVGISVVALAVAISGGIVAYRTWSALATRRFENVQAWGRGEFMAVVGVFISVVFTIASVWGGLAPLLSGVWGAQR